MYTTQALPLNVLMLAQGLHLKYLAPKATELGATVKKVENGWLIERVSTGSIAERAGLAADDVLIAFNRHQLSKKPDEILPEWPLNSDINVHYWRDGVLNACAMRNQITRHQIGHYQIERVSTNHARVGWPLAL